MGLFLANHENYDAYVERRSKNGVYTNAGNTCNTGNIDWASYGIISGVSIFGTLLNKIGTNSDGQGGNDDDDDVIDDETQKQIEVLENKLKTDVYAQCGGTADGLNAAIKKGSDAIVAAQGKIDAINNGTDDISKQIATLKATDPNADVRKLESEKAFALQVAKQELENAKIYKANFDALKGEEENILLQIERLKDSDSSPEIKYDVTQEANELRNFNKKLSDFTSIIKFDSGATEEEKIAAAKELKKAYFGDSENQPIIDNKTAQNAWKLISPQIDKYLKK